MQCLPIWRYVIPIQEHILAERKRNPRNYRPTPDELTALITFYNINWAISVCLQDVLRAMPMEQAYIADLKRWYQHQISGIGRGMLKSTQIIQSAHAKGAKPESIRAEWNRLYIEELEAKGAQVPDIKVLDTRFRAAWTRHKNKSAY